MNIGFHIASCAGLPPDALLACSWSCDGLLHVTVRSGGQLREHAFTLAELQQIIDRQTLESWERLRPKEKVK